MPDWRWVTQVSMPNSTHSNNTYSNGMWLDFDGVEMIMPLPEGRINGARTRLGWLTSVGWHFIFVAEVIDPTQQEGDHALANHHGV